METDAPRLAALVLSRLRQGDAPHLALMHLLAAAASPALAQEALILAAADGDGVAVEAVRGAWASRPQAWSLVETVLSLADERGGPERTPRQDALAHWREAFDAIAAVHPEGGVALYALGDAGLLAKASEEIVSALASWGDLPAGSRVLDVGCGIGRLCAPLLAAGAAHVLGTDVSHGMLSEANRRCAGLAADFVQVSGRDLEAIGESRFDLVLALDVFPYLVDIGEDVAAKQLAGMARTLRPGGRLVIGNISYRGDEARDCSDAAAWAAAAELALLASPSRPFRLWDGLVIRMARPGEAVSATGKEAAVQDLRGET